MMVKVRKLSKDPVQPASGQPPALGILLAVVHASPLRQGSQLSGDAG